MDRKRKTKQIMAWAGIVILVLMYVVLLVLSLLSVEGWQTYFKVCLATTILLPIVLWVNIYLYDRLVKTPREKQEDNAS